MTRADLALKPCGLRFKPGVRFESVVLVERPDREPQVSYAGGGVEVNERRDIVIVAGLQLDGTTYQLHPLSRERVRIRFPNVQQAPSVFVGYDTQADFEALHGPMWGQITMLLTGVTVKRLQELGRVVIWAPSTGREFEVQQ